jgi:hypothetical protein
MLLQLIATRKGVDRENGHMADGRNPRLESEDWLSHFAAKQRKLSRLTQDEKMEGDI